ncbi:hypothetical protein Cgig2_006646 [Carnegiea gigantea]|uniref:J domain-containing protein required for chloroplast accumulation response 1 n=1 Tax=Carnegiea gigantea TaxID=171969 RepID=A0A9Q1GTR4_9CARY|nr:hypothetical protein Cgig2_006646 [Carnegiea gigantea]
MASISRRERVLLGYAPDSPSSFHSERSSGVDYSDVFGGPPRRFSIQESRNGSIDSVDGETFRGSFGEKPVFGNEMGVRRRYPSEDFFDDIFRGDQSSPSCSQSPRIVPAWDSFSSGPASRVMSPSRPLPPSAEPPAKFSSDFVASSSAPQSWNSPSSYSSRFDQTIQSHDSLHADTRLPCRPSPLSHHNSVDSKESPKAAKLQDKHGTVEDSKRSVILLDSNQFHFSIYKWAGKGVALVMPVRRRVPSRSKESIKMNRCLTDTERGGIDIPDDQSLSFKSSRSARLHSESAESQTRDDIAQELSESAFNGSSVQSTEKQVQGDVDIHGLEDPIESDRKANNPKSPEKIKKFNLKTLGSFLQGERKDETMVVGKGEKEKKVKDKEKPSLDDFVPSRKLNKVKADSCREGKDDPQKGEAASASEVKHFVKIFNQESPSEAARHVQGQNESRRWKDTNRTLEVDEEIKPTAKNHDEEEASSVNWEAAPAEDTEMANGDSFLCGKQQSDVSSSSRVSPALDNEPITNGVRDFALNIKKMPEDDKLTKNLIQDRGIQAQVDKKDEMKSYENKIRQWSKGKEVNIRALLSTLQYVLWPNSGWKPVPLVDIIEANAVKRAYQKALLCLHPDKLQQKGAAAHEKFIAEKVFDVLQEAWDQFNSLGPP